jgi:hypothetical protein
MIYSYGAEGHVANKPDDLVGDELALLLSGGKLTISTDKDIGVVISTPGEKILISSTDGEFHQTPWGTVAPFSKTGSFIQASGRIVLFPGTRLMNVEFDTLWMSSDIDGDVEFNFNVEIKTEKPAQKRKPAQKPVQKPASQPAQKPASQPASTGELVKKYRGKPIPKLAKDTTAHGVQFNRPKGNAPTKFHPAPMWSFSKGDWYGWFYPDGKPAYKPRTARARKDLGKDEEPAGGTKKRPREEEPIELEDFGEEAAEMESEKEVGGFPVYKVSTGKLADDTYCEMGQYSFCARPGDFGIVRDDDSAVGACAYKIEEPSGLGKFLMKQTKMGFICSKVNKSCGMTLSIGVEIEGVVYGVFRDTGSEGREPQSLGIKIDFIKNCITPLYSGIFHSTVEIDNPALEACINNWYNMWRLRNDSDEKWKILSDWASLCEEEPGGITDWQKFQDPDAEDVDDLEFDQTTFFDQPEVSAGQKQVFKPNLPFMNWLWEHYSFDPTEEAPIVVEDEWGEEDD